MLRHHRPTNRQRELIYYQMRKLHQVNPFDAPEPRGLLDSLLEESPTEQLEPVPTDEGETTLLIPLQDQMSV